MVKRNPELVRSLLALLADEYRLHERYLKLLQEEKTAVTKARIDLIGALNQEREKLSEAMVAAGERRLQFMAGRPEGQDLRLTAWIDKHCHPADSKVLLPQARKLRDIIAKSRSGGREHMLLLNFALDMVNGTLSILWSATQNIFRSYSRGGNIREAYHPAESRAGTVLKKA